MNIKKLLFLAIFANFSVVTAQNFSIRGQMLSPFEGYIYLSYQNQLDSVKIENQQFEFTGKVPHPIKANLFIHKEKPDTGSVILEEGSLSADIVIENKKNIIFKNLRGSKSVNIVRDFLIFKNKNRENPRYEAVLFEHFKKIVKAHPKNQLVGMLAADLIQEREFSFAQASEIKGYLDLKAQDKTDLNRINMVLEALKSTQVGAIFPDIELPNAKNQPQKLSESRKTYTLVSFSSSNCVPCIELSRKYTEIYNQYKGKGFSIYEVYLEQDRELFLTHIEKEKIKWNTLFAFKRHENPVIKSLAINKIPANFLLDPSGKIIAANIGPTLLAKRLAESLK